MSFPPLAGGDHTILSSEFCSGYVDASGVWNTGFYCPQTGSVLAVYCCGTPTYKYCCTTKPINGTGAGIVEDFIFGGTGGSTTHSRPTGTITENGGDDVINLDGGSGGNEYSGATRMRPPPSSVPNEDLNSSDLNSLNLSDVPIIFGVACGVAAVLILVILVVFYLTSCCAHYHKLAQNRKRRSSSMPGIYRGVTTTNTSTTSGLVNLYSPTHSSVGTSIVGGGGSLASGLGAAIASTSQENTQTYIVHHHHHNNGSNPPASPDSSNAAPAEHYQVGGMGPSASLVTTPLDIEWSSTTQYLQKPQQAIMTSSGHQLHHQQPLNLLSNHIIAATTDNRIHYTVHQTQNRLAVALTGSMNRLSDHRGSTGSPCSNPASSSSSYPVNIPLTSPDIGYNYPRQIFSRGLSPPPQYSRAESPPYYPSYGGDAGGGNMGDSLQQPHNYLSRTSTLPLSLARKPPSGASGNRTPLVTSPLGTSYMSSSQQPKSILRTSENFRRVVTNETPPPIPPHNTNSSFTFGGGGSMEGGIGSIAYRSVDSRTNLSSQPLLILDSNVESSTNKDVQVPPPTSTSGGGQDEQEEDDDDGEESGLHTATLIRRPSSAIASAGVSASSGGNEEEEEDERRDQFDIHDIDSDAFSRLLEIDCDSKL